MESKIKSDGKPVAYDIFMDFLRSRALQPGQMITQKELLELTGMSLGPVRRALARLEAEGFVRILPQHGIRIVEPSLTLFKDITQIRIALEKEAWTRFSLAAPERRITRYINDHKAFLEECNGRITQDIMERVTVYDRAMHNAVIHEMRNERLTDIYRISLDTTLFMRSDKGYVRPYTIRNTLHEHLEILSAAESQDILALQEAVERHIMGAVHRFVL